MKILISGVCGFVGSHLARYLIESHEGITIVGLDNLTRLGSETNRVSLRHLGVQLFHGDIRMASDLETLPLTDWVIDAAAQPSVLAGRDGKTSSRQLIEHNLLGTINVLEYCRSCRAGLILLSTSRVYSIPVLAQLPVRVESSAFTLDQGQPWPAATSDHLREFSLDEIRVIVGELFGLEKIIGIKQGSIFFSDDPVGSNTFMVAKKPMGRDAAGVSRAEGWRREVE